MTLRAFGVAAALLVLPRAGYAHAPIEGLDDFYAGLLHPLFVPAHLLGVLALGILVGQQGVQRVQVAVIAYFAALAGGLAAAGFGVSPSVGTPLLLLASLSGMLVALAVPLPAGLLGLLGGLLGGLIGLDSPQPQLQGDGLAAALLGTAIGGALLMLYALLFAEWFSRHPWQRIGLRVFGSWVAASAVLVLSLALSS